MTTADMSPPPGAVAKGSSFYLAMRMLPRAQREAMYAVYKICRALEKSSWLALLLLLPVINIFTFLYLAFSGDGSEDAVPQKITFQRQ